MAYLMNAILIFVVILIFNMFDKPSHIWIALMVMTFLASTLTEDLWTSFKYGITAGIISLLLGGLFWWLLHTILGVQTAPIYFIGVVHAIASFAGNRE
jgi:hypothetical protein